MGVAELLEARQEYRQRLEAADKAILLSRNRFLVLSSMELKFRIYRRLGWGAEARQVAAHLLDQEYINAEPSDLLSALARADGGVAVRKGFLGMGVFALEKASRGGGVAAEEAARQLSRLEKTLVSRPKIVGLVPLSGRDAGMGVAVLARAEGGG